MVEQYFRDKESGIIIGIVSNTYYRPSTIFNPFSEDELDEVCKPNQARTLSYYCWSCRSYLTIYSPEHINQCPVCKGTLEFLNLRTPRGQNVLDELSAHEQNKIRWD